MRTNLTIAAAAGLLMIAGCGKPAEQKQADPTAGQDVVTVPDESAPAETNADTTSWVGKWTGVEGMYVNIKQTGEGKFSLEMQSDLDTKGTYEGVAEPDGITFKRSGETLTLRASDGDATGLKWLAGKKDCLTVKEGEGYCRD